MGGDPLARLPHGPGFRFLDAMVACEPGRAGTFRLCLPAAHPILAAHFPGRPLVPGVILLEAMAQAAGVVWGAAEPDVVGDRYLADVGRARFRAPVGADEAVTLVVTCERVLGAMARFQGEARVGTRVAAEAEFTLARVAP